MRKVSGTDFCRGTLLLLLPVRREKVGMRVLSFDVQCSMFDVLGIFEHRTFNIEHRTSSEKNPRPALSAYRERVMFNLMHSPTPPASSRQTPSRLSRTPAALFPSPRRRRYPDAPTELSSASRRLCRG